MLIIFGAILKSRSERKVFVYRTQKPFHPVKLRNLMSTAAEKWKGCGILGGNGRIWIASKNDECRIWEQNNRMEIEDHHGGYWKEGDRKQEISFIGSQGMNKEKIKKDLDSCLLTNEEIKGGPEKWEKLIYVSLCEKIEKETKLKSDGGSDDQMLIVD